MSRLPGPRSPAANLRFGRLVVSDLPAGLMALWETYGEVVRFGQGPFKFTYLFGPAANRYLLAENPHNFRWRDITKVLIPVDGDTALVVSDGEDHQRRRRIVQPAFHKRRIDRYGEVIGGEIQRELAGWSVGQTVDVHDRMRHTIRRIVLRSLFGEALGDQAEAVGDALEEPLAYVSRPPQRRFDVNLPGTPYRRALVGRRAADAIIYAEIDRRRREATAGTSGAGQGDDVLSWLLDAQDPESTDGASLSDEEVRDQVVSLVAAGYDTTSAAAAWAVHLVYSDPTLVDRLRAEVEAATGGGPVTVESLGAMPWIRAAVSETLRIYPPGILAGRRAIADFEFGGHRIRAGSRILYSPFVTHRMPNFWPDPLTFRPERWIESEGGGEPEPYSWVPFGGGYRRCIGFAFARMELEMLLAETVRRVDLDLLVKHPVGEGIATFAPIGGLPVHIRTVRSGR